MRFSWNENWSFTKDEVVVTENESKYNWEKVTIPHTWNGEDGQDGGNDYYRGICFYRKVISGIDIPKGQDVYVEFEGSNSSATFYLNGKELKKHHGGYSTWRVNISEELDLNSNQNVIIVAVDNRPNDFVYPQVADFTFYGGIYRNVNLIYVPKKRFDLDYYGGNGILVTPIVQNDQAEVTIESFFTNLTNDEIVEYVVEDEGKVLEIFECEAKNPKATLTIKNPHLWHGRKDPHLYLCKAFLKENGEVIDSREVRFGIRSFYVDPQKGFFLNGESYPLRGVSRHQDRPKIGNAIGKEHHKEDIEFIYELGATTIRLAHYQHDQYFYDLCDEYGFVIWAEIPYISEHMPKGRENTISQMKELITQNYNHPCIAFWGLSNEITMKGENDPDLIENHRILNDLCHTMDPTRPTTVAAVSMCDIHSTYLEIPDLVSYNHYFGWYGGDTGMNGPFMDRFHQEIPDKPIGMSEYGCEGLDWHTSEPKQGDYTEEYQAFYHEELIKQLFTRDFIWSTYVWNMFDFAADARSEGGSEGMNNKGLMTFDRKYKKDAFYAYKAWLSDEPFVHICGKRYVERVEDETKVTVYSNEPWVELYVNGEVLLKQESEDHFFYFSVPNKGKTVITAKTLHCSDESKLEKVDEFPEKYRMKEAGEVLNWFEITTKDGYFSINDTVGEILSTSDGKALFMGMIAMMPKKEGSENQSFEMTEETMRMVNGFTVKRILSMMSTMGVATLTKEQMIGLNQQLNGIKKPE